MFVCKLLNSRQSYSIKYNSYALFKTDRGNKETNKRLDLYVSERISIIIHEYLLNDPDGNLAGHFHRAFFVIGLYCLSKWIATNKICKDEYGYYVLLNKIDSLAAEI